MELLIFINVCVCVSLYVSMHDEYVSRGHNTLISVACFKLGKLGSTFACF